MWGLGFRDQRIIGLFWCAGLIQLRVYWVSCLIDLGEIFLGLRVAHADVGHGGRKGNLKFSVSGLYGYRVQGSGFRVPHLGFRVVWSRYWRNCRI